MTLPLNPGFRKSWADLGTSIPLAELQDHSFRNLVSCCRKCNSQKSDLTAESHLRRLYDDARLSAAQLSARLRALDALVAGKLRPPIPSKHPQRRHLAGS